MPKPEATPGTHQQSTKTQDLSKILGELSVPDDIREKITHWLSPIDDNTAKDVINMDYTERGIKLIRLLRGINGLTADEIRAMPPDEKEAVLLRYEAAWSQMRANIEKSVTLGGSGYKEKLAKMSNKELTEEVLRHKRGLEILLLNLSQGTDVAMPHDVSTEAKNLLAILVTSIPVNVRYKLAVTEIENLGKKIEALGKNHEAKVQAIGKKAETQLTAEKQKYDAEKTATEAHYHSELEKMLEAKGNLEMDITKFEEQVAKALIRNLGLGSEPGDQDKIAGILGTGFNSNFPMLVKLLEEAVEARDLARTVGIGATNAYEQEFDAHTETKNAHEKERAQFDKSRLEDGMTITNQKAELKIQKLNIAEMSRQLSELKAKREKLLQRAFDLKKYRASNAPYLREVHNELAQAQSQVKELESYITNANEMFAKAREIESDVQTVVTDAVIADRKAFGSYMKRTLAKCALVAIVSGALSYNFIVPHLRKFYAPRTNTVYVKGPEIKVLGPERIVEKRVEIPVDKIIYRDAPLADVPAETLEYKGGQVYVRFGNEAYLMNMQTVSDIYKEIKQDESKLEKKLSPAERKQHFDAHVKERIIK